VETVLPEVSGVLVDDLDPRAFADAIAATIDRRFDVAAIRVHAERFSRARFADEMSVLIHDSCPDAPSGAEGCV
jgi:glycosyltransferase involved in cell wall biosynthesis